MQIIGKRHFGKKAAPPGGGGGQFPTRELFDTLLLWNPSVVLDAKGEAVVQVPLNDSLTSFRIVAIADVVQGAQSALFGTGQATIAATQDLQIVSGVPPLVREGDHYKAMFTLRNTSKAAMNASLAASAGAQSLPAQTVPIAAGAAVDVAWDVDVPFNVASLAWTVAADAGAAHDRMKFAQKVAEAVPVTVQQATLVQLDKTLRIPIAPPVNALADAQRQAARRHRRGAQAEAGRRPARRARLLRALSVELLRAAGLDLDRPARHRALARAGRPGCRCTRTRTGCSNYFPATAPQHRQRQPHRLRAGDQRRGHEAGLRLRAARRRQGQPAARADRLRRGQGQPRLLASGLPQERRPRRAQARRDRGVEPLRQGAAAHARLDPDPAQPVAHRRGDRLAADPRSRRA